MTSSNQITLCIEWKTSSILVHNAPVKCLGSLFIFCHPHYSSWFQCSISTPEKTNYVPIVEYYMKTIFFQVWKRLQICGIGVGEKIEFQNWQASLTSTMLPASLAAGYGIDQVRPSIDPILHTSAIFGVLAGRGRQRSHTWKRCSEQGPRYDAIIII